MRPSPQNANWQSILWPHRIIRERHQTFRYSGENENLDLENKQSLDDLRQKIADLKQELEMSPR